MQLAPALLFPGLALARDTLPALSRLLINLSNANPLQARCLHQRRPVLHEAWAVNAAGTAAPSQTFWLHPNINISAGSSYRHFSSSSSTSASGESSSSSKKAGSGSGSSNQRPHELLAAKCRVLPFSLSIEEAEAAWEAHHQGFFTSHPGKWASVKPSLLPFWCFSAEVHITVHSAQVGRDYLASRYNPATRRNETYWDTAWATVRPNWRYSRRWGAEAEQMQVYGGAKYRHDPALDRMRPLEAVRRALPYSEYVKQADARQGGQGGQRQGQQGQQQGGQGQ
ncbi:hypothetical protein Agub_g15938, partial [Astrephomene gubernaculifera]